MLAAPNSRTIVADVRCLQDPNYARRGVGRYTLALLSEIPLGNKLRLVGLVDPTLPPLIEEARSILHNVASNAYSASLGWPTYVPATCFVSLSPMTHDPLFCARLLSDPLLLRIAVVHDFIPYRDASRYLPGPVERLRYATSLRWLARHDLFATNSRGTAEELSSLLGVAAADITVTGCPVGPAFERIGTVREESARQHILVVGGGDSRKNPEIVIRAHARSGRMQRDHGVPLVIAGSYGDEFTQRFRAISAAAGGRPSLISVPGQVTEAKLLEMYGHAMAVVCPSRDEGFSIPVVEGMEAGAPCLVSDIPAHRELVPDASQRFGCDDEDALRILLERVIGDLAWREKVLANQALTWPGFRTVEVGRRFWGPLVERMQSQPRSICGPSVLRNAKPRVALLSPLPPDRSGVADYTAATCSELGRLVDLHLFTETERPLQVAGATSIRPLTALPQLMSEFDRVIGVIGNSHFHLRIFNLLQDYGGAAIAHDARMLGFYRILLGQERALATASRELKRQVTEAELNIWLGDEGKLEALFLGDIAESATPMIVHSPVTAREVRDRHNITPAYLPFSICRRWAKGELSLASRSAARARLGLSPHEIVIATFGFVQRDKAPEECVWALEILRNWGVPASLHFVGSTSNLSDHGASLRALIMSLKLNEFVRFVDEYASDQLYKDYLVGANLAVQLRTYGLGGLSGALLDCASAGLPTVVNASLGEAVGVPRTYVRTIPDALSPFLLAEELANLLELNISAENTGDERYEFSRSRSLSVYAAKLCDALNLKSQPIAHRLVFNGA